MRFAITLTDRFKPVLDACLAAGWEPVKLFSVPLEGQLHGNRQIVADAARLGLPLQLSPIQPRDLQQLAEDGCEALLAASYNWRIPDWRPHLRYGVNFHPSPLPVGRGPYPLPRAILGGRTQWATCCHALDPDFDSGAVLAREDYALDVAETLETLEWKNRLALGRLSRRLTADLPRLWRDAVPQDETQASYWPRWSEAERTLPLAGTLDEVSLRLRAFGELNCLARVNQVDIIVHRAQGWRESHGFAPGSLVQAIDLEMLVALRDGFLVISEWSLQAPGARDGRRPFQF